MLFHRHLEADLEDSWAYLQERWDLSIFTCIYHTYQKALDDFLQMEEVQYKNI